MLGFLGNLAKKHMGLKPDILSEAKPAGEGGKNYNSDMMAHMRIGSKWSYSTLEYPMDIQQRSDLSHYMMFYVNVPITSGFPATGRTGQGAYSIGSSNNNVKKMAGKNPMGPLAGPIAMPTYKSAPDPMQNALQTYGGFPKDSGTSSDAATYDTNGNTWKPGQSNKVVARAHHDGTAAEGLKIKRTTRTNDSIVLYMPPQINVATTANYKDSEIGGMAGETGQAIRQFLDTSASDGIMAGALEAVPNIAQVMKTQIEKAGAALASGAGMGDIKGAYDKLANRAENNYLEAMFQGIGFRSFSWMWRFTPKNPAEVEMVDKIIRTFRFYMLPELPKDKRFGRYFIVPAEFDIFYMFRGEENSYLNKITSCVLKNCTVNYSPTQYQTFRPIQGRKGAPPIEIEMKLDFQETKLITKEDVLEGY